MAWLQTRALVGRFNKGDVYALQEIYDLHKKDMMTLAASLMFDKSVAEDVLHEVFVKLIGLQGRLRIKNMLRGYLLQAVANEARTMNRARARKESADKGKFSCRRADVDSPDGCAERTEQHQRLTAALGELPYEQREVVLLRHYGQVKFKAIAKAQGVSMSTVQARYRYGLSKLRSLLGRDL
ncbi:RNA polymerase sigma factor [Planctomycetota bacterium]